MASMGKMMSPDQDSNSPKTAHAAQFPKTRIRFGLIIVGMGFLMFLLGTKPAVFGLERSPNVGFIKIAVFLVGLAVICMGGYVSLLAFWRGEKRTIAADIGSRLVATGYVVAVFSGMADVFGFGTQPLPEVPYFGPWQALGVMLGEAIIVVGFLLLVRFPRRR